MNHKLAIAVVGLGKIGLPIAAQYAAKGNRVVGADVSPHVVDSVNAGRSYLVGEPLLAERVGHAVSAGLLRATRDTAAAASEAEVVVVAVPLIVGVDGLLDFRALDDATSKVAQGIKAGTLIIYETTLPLGATRGRLGPALERHSGLRLGTDLFLAFSPERVSSGRVFKDLATYPKIVGGVDSASTERAAAFYSVVLDAEVTPVADAETAEYAKLAETTYRFVNIALADQLAAFGRDHGVNVTQAFAAANSQPYSHIHQPGIGIGGHCIPVYPRFLLEAAGNADLSLVRAATEVDEAMQALYVRWLASTLGSIKEKRILVLGVCYRANVKETAFSAAFPVIEALRQQRAHVVVHDALLGDGELRALGLEPINLDSPIAVDAVIIQAFHDEYRDLHWERFIGLRAVADGRGVLQASFFEPRGVAFMSLGANSRPRVTPGSSS